MGAGKDPEWFVDSYEGQKKRCEDAIKRIKVRQNDVFFPLPGVAEKAVQALMDDVKNKVITEEQAKELMDNIATIVESAEQAIKDGKDPNTINEESIAAIQSIESKIKDLPKESKSLFTMKNFLIAAAVLAVIAVAVLFGLATFGIGPGVVGAAMIVGGAFGPGGALAGAAMSVGHFFTGAFASTMASVGSAAWGFASSPAAWMGVLNTTGNGILMGASAVGNGMMMGASFLGSAAVTAYGATLGTLPAFAQLLVGVGVGIYAGIAACEADQRQTYGAAEVQQSSSENQGNNQRQEAEHGEEHGEEHADDQDQNMRAGNNNRSTNPFDEDIPTQSRQMSDNVSKNPFDDDLPNYPSSPPPSGSQKSKEEEPVDKQTQTRKFGGGW